MLANTYGISIGEWIAKGKRAKSETTGRPVDGRQSEEANSCGRPLLAHRSLKRGEIFKEVVKAF